MRTRILAAVVFACCLVGWGSPSDASTRHHHTTTPAPVVVQSEPVSGCSFPSDTGNPACGSGTMQRCDASGVCTDPAPALDPALSDAIAVQLAAYLACAAVDPSEVSCQSILAAS